jgi:phosphoribosylaminoimidazole carboxylase PurE protein
MKPSVLIMMGSDSDLDVMRGCADMLDEFGVPYRMTVSSAHRTPQRTLDLVREAEQQDIKVIIAGAGAAAHLAGVVASHTTLPVIGVPINSSPLEGVDALYSTVQMPPGIPVATMAVGRAGARNAAIFAVEVLALNDDSLASALEKFRKKMADEVESKARRVEGE